jgi:hypothetical protein
VKSTKYFQFRRSLPDRREIRDDWIDQVVRKPIKTVKQGDGRIKKWGRIEEADGRWLRVILLEDGETVHNAFFDRNFRE